MYAYRLRSTRHSSRKFGNCEVCDKHATEVFIQVELKAVPWLVSLDSQETDPARDSYRDCSTSFGHRDCLIAAQRAA